MNDLKPDHELTPGVAFIAILLHDKTALGPFDQQDALWIKCPKEKEVSSLLKAYKKRLPEAGEIVLRHDFAVVHEKTKISTLATRPPNDFVALEAIRLQDLDKDKAKTMMTPSRSPLTEVTNTVSQSGSKAAATIQSTEDLKIKQYTPPTRALSGHPQNVPDAQHVQSPTHSNQSDQIGWEDFLFERLELQRQLGTLNPLKDDEAIKHEWLGLQPGQQSFFIQRGAKVTATERPEPVLVRRVQHGTFWCFYYERYFAFQRGSVDPHRDFVSQIHHSEICTHLWTRMGSTEKARYTNIVMNHVQAAVHRGIVDSMPGPVSNAQTFPHNVDTTPGFKREPTPSPEPEDSTIASFDGLAETKDFHVDLEDAVNSQNEAPVRLSMSELFDHRTPEQLERGVERGVELLSDIHRTLQEQPSEEAGQWIQALEKVQKQAARSRTVIGVVGATGAGKSSVINAMLDEERLVPTNCMRACTAVVTEISYNYDDAAPYRAEVEFISRDDWLKMLKVMFQDLLDGSGQVSRECTNEDSESGIAYAQVKAVYPKLTKEEMEHVPIDRLMSHENVKCLGTTRNLEADDPLLFYKKLQHYVDSKEKTSGKKEDGEKEKKKPREMEFWPLIRMVRLYVKAPALATGAVVVDLPGVHDSNQARAAVAQSYMKQCTGLWIVAPITRAVDDKSAKNLLGDSFKRQLKMDGGYNSVTFICSKTDDISITEAQDSLGLEEELGPMWTKWEGLRKKKNALKKQIEDLKDTKSDINAAIEAADEEVEVWEKLQEDCNAGKPVYKPKAASQKRKRVEVSIPSKKKPKYAEPDTDDEFNDDGENSDHDAASDYASSDTNEDRGPPLTDDEITSKIAELRVAKKEGRREKLGIDEQMKDLRREIEQIDKENESIDAELSAKCISGRNEYSRGAIRQDYASGIRELDQELAEEADAANFNPEVDTRDYDEVARNLPVFCVSSRAYQKLKGRLQRDKTPPGFKLDETEVPALQAHCIQLTTADRQTASRRFLNSLFQLLNSLRLWASNDGTGNNLTEDQLQREAQILKERLNKLDSALEKAVSNLMGGIADELQDKVYDVYPAATTAAKSQADDTARKWGSPVNRDNRAAGGLYWATYKAVVRREGCFTNAWGCHNFNEQLVEPVIRHIAGPWESVFSRRMPGILNGLPLHVGQMLMAFHEEVERRAVRNGVSTAAFHMLKHQLAGYKETLKDAMNEARAKITEKQREINREFEPQITKHMLDIYDVCVRESGPGSYARMRANMARYIEEEKESMFEDAVEHVRRLIEKMLKEVKEDMLTKVDGIFMSIERDYTGVVIGQDKGEKTEVLPRDQRALRKAVIKVVDGAELIFKRAVGLEPDPGPEPGPDARVKTEDCEGKEGETTGHADAATLTNEAAKSASPKSGAIKLEDEPEAASNEVPTPPSMRPSPAHEQATVQAQAPPATTSEPWGFDALNNDVAANGSVNVQQSIAAQAAGGVRPAENAVKEEAGPS